MFDRAFVSRLFYAGVLNEAKTLQSEIPKNKVRILNKYMDLISDLQTVYGVIFEYERDMQNFKQGDS